MGNQLKTALLLGAFDAALEGRESLVEGKKYKFKIMSVDATGHKIALSMKDQKK